MKPYQLFEQRKSSKKWNSLEEAKRGLYGTPQQIEVQAKARLKAQDIFIKIREGKG